MDGFKWVIDVDESIHQPLNPTQVTAHGILVEKTANCSRQRVNGSGGDPRPWQSREAKGLEILRQALQERDKRWIQSQLHGECVGIGIRWNGSGVDGVAVWRGELIVADGKVDFLIGKSQFKVKVE